MSKLNLFVTNRDVTVGGTLGYRLMFQKGVPLHVPPQMQALVMERGAIPCDEKGRTLESSESPVQPEPKILVAPEDAAEREVHIRKAMDAIVARNNAKDFTAGGTPSAEALSTVVGWRVDRTEARQVWLKHRAPKE